MITGRQIRAARGLLRWRIEDLAQRSELTREAITRIEDEAVQPRTSTLIKIEAAFKKEGVEFLDDNGVRQKDDRVREIDGPNCYARLLDEIYYELQEGDEILVGMVDETLSPPEVHEAYRRLIKKGITYKKLIQEGNTHICGPLSWYRQMPSEYYQNSATIFFKDRSAYVTEDFKKIVVLKDKALARANKNFFRFIWAASKEPTKTTADETYI